MYERMLNKEQKPAGKEFADYCGKCKNLLAELDVFLLNDLKTEKLLRFPYGASYGWGMKYFLKSKHICDVFAEKDAFTVMIRLSNTQFNKAYEALSNHTKALIDNKYPCGDGGWIHARVLEERGLNDIKILLQLKANR